MRKLLFSGLVTLLTTFSLLACTAAPVAPSFSQSESEGVNIQAATEPAATEPAATEPAATEPAATEPASTEPQITSIVLGDATQISGAGAETTENGVRITEAGTYVLSGTLADGMVEVDAPDAVVTLILNGVSVTNSNGPAIFFASSSESIVTLAAGSENALADGGVNDELDAALFSRASLTINGEGNLVITGNNQEGIASEMHLNVAGGNIWVTSVDDGLNANNDGVSIVTVSGGYLFVTSGGDGIDSNGAINFTGGTTIAMSALTDASGGIDADGDITIAGGTVIATGARNSGPAAASTQKTLAVNYTSTQAAGTLAGIVEPDGAPALIFAPAVAYQQLVYSAPEIVEGVTYTVYTGGEAIGTLQDGLYLEGAYTPGTQIATVTTQSASTLGGPGGAPRP